MNIDEKNTILKRLKSKDKKVKIYCNNIPEIYQEDKDIIDAERKSGIRVVDRIGFDVIHQVYFVHEKVLYYDDFCNKKTWQNTSKAFEKFNDYYNYLNGDIYNNACYYQCNFSNIKQKIDISRMKEKNSFVKDNISNYTITPSNEEKLQYIEGEERKKQIKKWANKFILCDSLQKLKKTIENYKRSFLNTEYHIDVVFFFWIYIFYDLTDKHRFEIIMQYISKGYYPEYKLIRPLCHIYDANDVLINYNHSSDTKQTYDEYKQDLKRYIESSDYKQKKETEVYFDTQTHYYCERDSFGVHRFFETFEDLIRYRNNDLSNADLTKDIKLNYDFTHCKINNNTKLPIGDTNDLKYVIKKKYSNGKFKILQAWYNKSNILIKQYTHEFDYFFDFVTFLNGDLSNADFLLCDGLKNLSDISAINFSNAIITSSVCDQLGLKYEEYKIDLQKIESFAITEEYEKNTEIVLQSSEKQRISDNCSALTTKEFIYYISDLHLMHKLKYFNPKSKTDVIYAIHVMVSNIIDEIGNTLLIGGDIASDYTIFELFIRLLRNELDRNGKNSKVIIVLGNHELWEFPTLTFNKIIKKYEKLITDCGMYLLQNDILYKNSEQEIHKITNAELISLSKEEIRHKLRNARSIFFGGLAFSGYDENFNANHGMYRTTIDRNKEIKESKRFEKLYNKILSILPDKKLVIFTHTPMNCWRKKVDYHKNYVYVSGHTHKNHFYDDGQVRIYSDNQIGYANNNFHLKCFDIDNEYDYFSEYQDGIYQISIDDYKQFYHGKNISITFNQKIDILYMLKKNGYYCFICQLRDGSLNIINGGTLKKLNKDDIDYYYDNMDIAIAITKKTFNQYINIQEKVASEIRKLGGNGTIHGCIIDIDWYNHIYINPVDLTMIGYWASSIINKKIYPNIPALLEKECPAMYAKYTKLLKDDSENLPIIAKDVEAEAFILSQTYLDTDIYTVSRETKKIQELSSNILTIWQ